MRSQLVRVFARSIRSRGTWALVGWLVAVGASGPARAADEPRFTRTEVKVAIPNVTLIDQDGKKVSFHDMLVSDTPVFVDFIFATCTTICPVLSAGYASIQRKLADEPGRVRLVSITIDPENDGPAELRTYLERYGARPGWEFLTGTRDEIDRVMRAFDAWIPDKMSHRPLVFIRSPGDGSWVRLYGFAGSKDLMAELERAEGRSTMAEVQR
jgi:protein SCO1/2